MSVETNDEPTAIEDELLLRLAALTDARQEGEPAGISCAELVALDELPRRLPWAPDMLFECVWSGEAGDTMTITAPWWPGSHEANYYCAGVLTGMGNTRLWTRARSLADAEEKREAEIQQALQEGRLSRGAHRWHHLRRLEF